MALKADQIDRDIGQRLKRLREKAGLTQPQVGEYLGVQYQSYQRMESGRSSWRASTLRKLAALYRVKVSDVIGVDAEFDILDPDIIRVVLILMRIGPEARKAIYNAALVFKNDGEKR